MLNDILRSVLELWNCEPSQLDKVRICKSDKMQKIAQNLPERSLLMIWEAITEEPKSKYF